MPKKYSIEFETRELPGKMIITHVELYTEIIDMKTQEAKKNFDELIFNIDLADSPHYLALQRYVKANPR